VIAIRAGTAAVAENAPAPAEVVELLLKAKTLIRAGWYGILEEPLALLERCIRASTSEGALVFDPFLGGGTTAVACARTGRRFVGTELEREHIAQAHLDGADFHRQPHRDGTEGAEIGTMIGVERAAVQGARGHGIHGCPSSAPSAIVMISACWRPSGVGVSVTAPMA
jgi:hypothetical protein